MNKKQLFLEIPRPRSHGPINFQPKAGGIGAFSPAPAWKKTRPSTPRVAWTVFSRARTLCLFATFTGLIFAFSAVGFCQRLRQTSAGQSQSPHTSHRTLAAASPCKVRSPCLCPTPRRPAFPGQEGRWGHGGTCDENISQTVPTCPVFVC